MWEVGGAGTGGSSIAVGGVVSQWHASVARDPT